MWALQKGLVLGSAKYCICGRAYNKTAFLFSLENMKTMCNSRGKTQFSKVFRKENLIQTRFYQMEAQVGRDNTKHIGPLGWFLMLIPVTTFCLGTWQVKRRKWKIQLIEDLRSKTTAHPVELPEELSEIDKLEYYPVKVRGEFDHSKEMLLGPRSLLTGGDATSQGGLISHNEAQGNQSGFLVITPFKLTDKGSTILVQRGWVPNKFKSANTRVAGQVKGEVELTGIVRLQENRAPFVPHNKAGSSYWYYRDIEGMSHAASTEPIFIDATAETSIPGGPIGGQTRVTLRNEHMSYILTWYGLSAATSYLWYRQFIQKLPLK